jgi:NitT/TauT family transport system substrate-binding protein
MAEPLVFTSAPVLVAIEKGFFQEQGIDVELERTAGGADVIPQLATGEIAVVHGGISPGMFNAVERGIEVRVIAPLNMIPPGEGSTQLLIRKDLADRGELRTPADLRDRRVAVNTSGSLVAWQLDKVLEQHGLSITEVDRVTIPFPEMPVALANGSVDAIMVVDPFRTNAITQGVGVQFITQTTPGAMTTSIIASGKWLQEQPDVVRRYTVGLMKGVRDLQPEKGKADVERLFRPENVAIYQKYLNAPEEVMRRWVPSVWEPDLEIPIATLMEQQAWFQKYGQLTYTQLLPAERVVDESYARHARDVLARAR